METVGGAVRRLSKISNCAFECDYYFFVNYVYGGPPLSRSPCGFHLSTCGSRLEGGFLSDCKSAPLSAFDLAVRGLVLLSSPRNNTHFARLSTTRTRFYSQHFARLSTTRTRFHSQHFRSVHEADPLTMSVHSDHPLNL